VPLPGIRARFKLRATPRSAPGSVANLAAHVPAFESFETADVACIVDALVQLGELLEILPGGMHVPHECVQVETAQGQVTIPDSRCASALSCRRRFARGGSMDESAKPGQPGAFDISLRELEFGAPLQ
jgi:hypothetical protein